MLISGKYRITVCASARARTFLCTVVNYLPKKRSEYHNTAPHKSDLTNPPVVSVLVAVAVVALLVVVAVAVARYKT